MSKGSKQRPTDLQKYSENYDRIFRKKKTYDALDRANQVAVKKQKSGG